ALLRRADLHWQIPPASGSAVLVGSLLLSRFRFLLSLSLLEFRPAPLGRCARLKSPYGENLSGTRFPNSRPDAASVHDVRRLPDRARATRGRRQGVKLAQGRHDDKD